MVHTSSFLRANWMLCIQLALGFLYFSAAHSRKLPEQFYPWALTDTGFPSPYFKFRLSNVWFESSIFNYWEEPCNRWQNQILNGFWMILTISLKNFKLWAFPYAILLAILPFFFNKQILRKFYNWTLGSIDSCWWDLKHGGCWDRGIKFGSEEQHYWRTTSMPMVFSGWAAGSGIQSTEKRGR